MVLFDMEIYIPPISPLATTNIAYEAAISFFKEFVQKFAWFDMLIWYGISTTKDFFAGMTLVFLNVNLVFV